MMQTRLPYARSITTFLVPETLALKPDCERALRQIFFEYASHEYSRKRGSSCFVMTKEDMK